MPRGKPRATKGAGSPPKPKGHIRSIRDLATRLAKSHTAVQGWVKHPSWTFGAGPWDPGLLPAMQDWARRTLAPDPADLGTGDRKRRPLTVAELDPRQQADYAAKLIKAKREQFRYDKEQGFYHRVDECEQRRVQQVLELKNALLQLPEGLPFPSDVRDVVRGRVVELLTRFSQGR